MRRFAPAKINLSLHISAPIKDGIYKNYHYLDSLAVFCDYGDYIEFSKAPQLNIEFCGEFGEELSKHDLKQNLIYRAAIALNEYCNTKHGAKIRLEKQLPLASGIGGGSADCAAVLLELNELWELGLENAQILEIGNNLGADVGVCINGLPIIMRNIGNDFFKAPNLPKKIPALIANPLINCPTPLIYKKYDEFGIFPQNIEKNYYDCDDLHKLVSMLKKHDNHLEKAAISIIPQIGELINELRQLNGVLMARMSGSGASVFAIFENDEKSIQANIQLHEKYKSKNQKIWAKTCHLNCEN